jgi:hypothetical protein
MRDFRELVDENVCYMQVVPNGSGWKCEYHPYAFGPPPRPNMRDGGVRPPPSLTEPDSTVIDEIYRTEIVKRLPRVVE